MFHQFQIATKLLFALTIIAGVLYPAIVTMIAQVTFPHQATGSILQDGDRLVGSPLIGQNFTKPEYFWGRLSATTPQPYNASSSSGSNFGPLNPALRQAAKARIEALRQFDSLEGRIPVDLVTASASGIDPHISPAAAEYQVPRVAISRKISQTAVRELVRANTDGRQFGVLGEPRVNVLRLNMALDQQSAAK